jgi:hypothetical protein
VYGVFGVVFWALLMSVPTFLSFAAARDMHRRMVTGTFVGSTLPAGHEVSQVDRPRRADASSTHGG